MRQARCTLEQKAAGNCRSSAPPCAGVCRRRGPEQLPSPPPGFQGCEKSLMGEPGALPSLETSLWLCPQKRLARQPYFVRCHITWLPGAIVAPCCLGLPVSPLSLGLSFSPFPSIPSSSLVAPPPHPSISKMLPETPEA